MHPDDQPSYDMQVLKQDEKIIAELLNQKRYSMCLTVFSFFEGRLKSICEMIESKFNFQIRIDDLNSKEQLLLYYSYLTKIFELDPKAIEKFYTPIRNQKIVRNPIAHQNAIPKGVRLRKFILSMV